jgi:CspA family cold shock protein
MPTGTVTFYNDDRGFGFLRPDDGGADVFVHISAFARIGLPAPAEGQRFAFDVEINPNNGKPAATMSEQSDAAKPGSLSSIHA